MFEGGFTKILVLLSNGVGLGVALPLPLPLPAGAEGGVNWTEGEPPPRGLPLVVLTLDLTGVAGEGGVASVTWRFSD
jgi:hypothetical protein